MKVDQLSIFLENRAGRLAEVTRILSETGVNIRALSLADTSDFGILRLIVSDFEKAKDALKAGGFTVGRTTVVAVEVPDHPGGLHGILEMLRSAGINVEYMSTKRRASSLAVCSPTFSMPSALMNLASVAFCPPCSTERTKFSALLEPM